MRPVRDSEPGKSAHLLERRLFCCDPRTDREGVELEGEGVRVLEAESSSRQKPNSGMNLSRRKRQSGGEER